MSDTDVSKAVDNGGNFVVKLSNNTIVDIVANFYRVEQGILNFYNYNSTNITSNRHIRAATFAAGKWLYVRDA